MVRSEGWAPAVLAMLAKRPSLGRSCAVLCVVSAREMTSRVLDDVDTWICEAGTHRKCGADNFGSRSATHTASDKGVSLIPGRAHNQVSNRAHTRVSTTTHAPEKGNSSLCSGLNFPAMSKSSTQLSLHLSPPHAPCLSELSIDPALDPALRPARLGFCFAARAAGGLVS